MEVFELPVDKVMFDPSNANKHNKKNLDSIKGSLARFKQQKPIVIDEDNIVVAGNGTLATAIDLGWDTIKCVRTTLTGVDKAAYGIADNRTSELAEWDKDILGNILQGLREDEFPIEDIGFDISDLEDMDIDFGLNDYDESKEDDVPEITEDIWVKEGDLFQLGEHRILCGDCTVKENVDRLMDGAKADMVFTDPPYGIAYDNTERWKSCKKQSPALKKNKGEMIIGDDSDFDPSFIIDFFQDCKEVFVWGMQYYPDKLKRGGAIVWNRKTKEQEKCPFADFELCWSKQTRNAMAWIIWGGFIHKEKGEKRLHTTQKPIALAEWFFDKWGKDTNIVWDGFLGSGSTLIACEKTNRKCFGLEISPEYIQVIIKRWEDYSSKTHKKL